MVVTTTTTFANALGTFVASKFIKQSSPVAVVANLINIDSTSTMGAVTAKIPRWPDVSGDVTDPVNEANGITPSSVTPTQVSLTPTEVGIAFELSKMLQKSGGGLARLSGFSELGADQMTQLLEDDICGLFPSITAQVGATGTDLGFTDFLQAVVLISTAQATPPHFAALHPRQVGDLALSVGSGGQRGRNGAFGDNIPMAGLVDTLAGMPVYNAPRVTDDATDVFGFMGGRDAITMRRLWGVEVDTDQIVSGGGPNIVISVNTAYAVGVTANDFGVEILSELAV